MMTHPDGRPYTLAERKAVVREARVAAKELLRKLEIIARMDGVDEHVALERTKDASDSAGGNSGSAGAAP
jgi:hypothetical protein